MKRRTSQRIGLWVVSLLLSTCRVPAPNTTPTSTFIPIKPAPTPFKSAAWQFWPAAALPQAVFDVARGEQFMWVGTSFGVVRLDPVTRTYTSYDQLGPALRVFPIADDAVYAGTSQGVYYFDGQSWSRVAFTSTYPIWSNSVTAFGLDAQGDLWMLDYASRASRLYRLTGHVPPAAPWNAALPDSGVTPAPALFPFDRPDCDNWPVLATFTYGYRTLDECRHYRHAYTLLERRGGYGPYAAEADDSFWWVSNDQLLHLSATDSVLSTRPLSTSSRLAPDPQHGVWIAAYDAGLFYATDADIQHVSIGLEKYTLYTPFSLAIDPQGTTWATTSSGVQQLSVDRQRWQLADNDKVIAQPSSLPFYLLTTASTEGIWLANSQELWHYDGRNLTAAPPLPGEGKRCVLNMIRSDEAGHMWGIGAGCGVLEFDPATNQWQRHFADQSFDQLSIGADGAIVISNYAGQLLARPSGSTAWKLLAHLDRAQSDPVIVADNHGGAWVGLRQLGEVWHYPAGSDQPTVVRVPTNDYFTLAIDGQSHLWLSTRDELMRYDGQAWQTVGAPPIGVSYSLATAPDGRLWFAGERGVAVYDPKLDK